MSKREQVRAAICGLHDEGKTAIDIAATLGCGRSTVYRTLDKIKVGEGIKHEKKTGFDPKGDRWPQKKNPCGPDLILAAGGRRKRPRTGDRHWRSLRRVKVPLIFQLMAANDGSNGPQAY